MQVTPRPHEGDPEAVRGLGEAPYAPDDTWWTQAETDQTRRAARMLLERIGAPPAGEPLPAFSFDTLR